ncbi:unnamed protein product [Brassica rapa]|uniref:Uncharacterized protein n=2 Tax=Brassica TaxID=3705 RepID=A0A3P6BBF7_BRACM|nr:unnamed protein product [Brassica napus]CAG7905043.1 unnamed protein product [Brassica rapa]VDD02523.1 unnamed protein product [Brassica rapa]
MKLRVKRPKSSPPPINSNLVFIIRIDVRNMHPKTKKATDCLFQKLLKVSESYQCFAILELKRTLRTSYSKRNTQ